MLNQEKQQKEEKKKVKCYVCKQPILVEHHHYAMLCYECGDFNVEILMKKNGWPSTI